MNRASQTLIESYYAAFNAGDMDALLNLLSEEVVHDINQGPREIGKQAFRVFLERMNRCYKEQVVDLVVLTSEDGTRAAAEFVVLGEYLCSDEGLPPPMGNATGCLPGPSSRSVTARWPGLPTTTTFRTGSPRSEADRAMTDAIAIRRFTGRDPELRAHVPDLARLRIEVFRDFPTSTTERRSTRRNTSRPIPTAPTAWWSWS